ncbi:MAG: glycosyltransferase [Planctomycetota bacterium]
MMVILSNGSNKFHLASAAAELDRRGYLNCLITGGYPTRRAQWLAWFNRSARVARLFDRGEPDLNERRVVALWLPEVILQSASLLRRFPATTRCSEFFVNWAMRLYGDQARKVVRNSSARVYHYRAGFGHASVAEAKKRGMLALCDHSIAHPALVEHLTNHCGQFPQNGQAPAKINSFWQQVLDDICQADHVVVNSDFVKQTFVALRWAPERIHVIYWGVDQKFLDLVPALIPKTSCINEPLRFLFAGAFSARKGADYLVQAFQSIPDLPWKLSIAGSIETPQNYQAFLTDPRVSCLGTLTRTDLIKALTQTDVFVFPSLAEGSARVVFEALACGCFIVTTPNSGTIVKHNEHGLLVAPGDASDLQQALRNVLAMDRNRIAEIGRKNAELIKASYTQTHYGDNLLRLYHQLIGV